VALLPRLPRLGLAGRLVRARLEEGISATALPALGHLDALPRRHDLPDHLTRVLVLDDGARRHADHHVLARGPGLLPAPSGLPVVGEDMLVVAEVHQRIQVLVGLHEDGASVAAVAARRPALRHKLFLTPRNDAFSPIATAHLEIDPVEKLHAGMRFVSKTRRNADEK